MARHSNNLTRRNCLGETTLSMISILTGDASSAILAKWSDKKPYVTGYDIASSTACSVTYGKIVYVGQEPDGTYTVNIKCNDNEIFRYGNLSSIYVRSADGVGPGTLLGDVKKYIHFEYATRWQGDSTFPIRVNQYLYFKQDPRDIVESRYKPDEQPALEYAPSRTIRIVDYLTESQQSEFQGK